jgi:hypothetical protein
MNKLYTTLYVGILGVVCLLAGVALWLMHNRLVDLNP